MPHPFRRQRVKVLFGIFAFGLSSVEVLALNPELGIHQYNIRTWRRPNGLPTNAINSIAQSSEGHVWLGTSKGLVVFDGITFNSIGLPGQEKSRPLFVAAMQRRSAGGFWLGLERGGYGYFENQHYFPLQESEQGKALFSTRVVEEAQGGGLFVGFVGSAAQVRPDGSLDVFSPNTDVQAIHQDKEGRVWLGTTSKGLQVLEKGVVRTIEGPAAQLWEGALITSVTVDHKGTIWVGASNGLHRLNPDFSPGAPTGIKAQTNALLVDGHGVLWIGTQSAGLIQYKKGAFSKIEQRDGLASNRILSLELSDEGSLWVGTEDGLSQLADVKFPVFSSAEGMPGEACLSVAAGRNGGVWLGTNNGLGFIKNGEHKAFGINGTDGFSSQWIKRIYPAKNGDVYLLGGSRDISCFRNGKVIQTWYAEQWPQALTEDKIGVILCAGESLYRLGSTGLEPYRLADGSEPVFAWINETLSAADGALWLATKAGVSCIRDGVVTDLCQGKALQDPAFYHLSEDSAGGLWAGRSCGLVRFYKGKLQTIGYQQGLHDEVTYSMVADQLGNFWFDSPSGIFKVKEEQLIAVAEGREPVLSCTVFDGQHVVKTTDKSSREYSGALTAEGQIWLPSAKGAIRIDPLRVTTNSQVPPLFIQRVLVDGMVVPEQPSPQLQPGAGNLEFDYTALDYQAPERIRFRYRLLGFQNDWVEAGARRSAFYTNLNPGFYRFEVQACNADGIWNREGRSYGFTLTPRFYQTSQFRVLSAFGACAVFGIVGLVRFRRRKQEMEATQKQELLQRQMIEGAPVSMVMLEDGSRVLHVNSTFTKTFGYTTDELTDIRTWWASVYVPEPNPEGEAKAAMQDSLASRSEGPDTKERQEVTLRTKEGSPLVIVVRPSQVGERILLVLIDITETRRADKERERLEERLRHAQKMEAIGQLSGGVAHDFNNLLTVIVGNLGMIECEEVLSDTIRDSLKDIKTAAQRAANLTKQLLAFSRKQALRTDRLDLNALVSDTGRMLKRTLGGHIALTVSLSAESIFVKADQGMIEQVLINLALNARDAMPTGGSLSLQTLLPEEVSLLHPHKPERGQVKYVCIRIADTGMGMTPEVLAHIFEPFYTTKEVGRGTGLGLATAYGIVEQHGGWFEVRSQPQEGSCFSFYLPLLPEGEPPALSMVRPAASSAATAKVILLVEDDAGVRLLARRTLELKGHRVLDASSGPAGYALWKEKRDQIELIFTDVVMPNGMNGIEMANRILEEKPELRVIYTSGYSVEVAGGHFSGREGVDFLPKPYTKEELWQIVDRED